MRRRDFIKAIAGSAAAAWPLAARAQQSDRRRRVAVTMAYAESDPEGQLLLHTFAEALEGFGWKANRNLISDYRWAGGDTDLMRMFAGCPTLRPSSLSSKSTSLSRGVRQQPSRPSRLRGRYRLSQQ